MGLLNERDARIVGERLSALPRPVTVALFTSEKECELRFAMESDLVRASMVEATEFPDLSGRYGVSGVPHTVIGNSPQAMIGAYPEAAAVDMVVAASQA